MLKLQTAVDCPKGRIGISYSDSILVIGSCFADSIGQKMSEAGFDVCVNPFGTLYNPVSICNTIRRLESGIPFTESDCEPMGAGAGLFCSFSHHTSFARKTKEEFTANANECLAKAHDFYKRCNKVIVTLGTSWCYKYNETGEIVSNCLKRNASEFTRERLPLEITTRLLSRLVARENEAGDGLGRQFIFTVSPIRHMADTAHGNQLSKSLLLLAEDSVCNAFPHRAEYFPSYEIVLDELRDYRFYAEDMIHPSSQTVNYIWERFTDAMLPDDERQRLAENERLFRRSQHRSMH